MANSNDVRRKQRRKRELLVWRMERRREGGLSWATEMSYTKARAFWGATGRTGQRYRTGGDVEDRVQRDGMRAVANHGSTESRRRLAWRPASPGSAQRRIRGRWSRLRASGLGSIGCGWARGASGYRGEDGRAPASQRRLTTAPARASRAGGAAIAR